VVVVATDHEEILALCRALGAEAVLTDPEHPSGTDRVAEVASLPGFDAFPVVVNVQGDEPLLPEATLEAAVALVRDGPWALGTCAAPLGDPAHLQNPGVVKAVRATDGRALYFSRAAVPHRRDGPPTGDLTGAPPYLRHIGIYSARREALFQWVALPPSPLEMLERLEQLRALEGGIPMGIAVVETAHGGVDTPEDLASIAALLEEEGRAQPGPDAAGAQDARPGAVPSNPTSTSASPERVP
jgi:3-deoxy-manno-octulosonate cytidylyltransferase (CMP-KDO synthetase)